MKRCIILSIIFLLISSICYSKSWKPEIGDMFHITGCKKKELVLPIINMWDKPGGLVHGARPIGKLSGDGRKDLGLKCQGSIVRLIEIKEIDGRINLKIKSIANSSVGWITNNFVGKRFKKSKCKKHFSEPEHLSNCLRENETKKEKQLVTVGESGANLYADPRDNKGFKKIRKGNKLEVLKEKVFSQGGKIKLKNKWYRVKYKKIEGWVSEHSLAEYNQKDWKKRNPSF